MKTIIISEIGVNHDGSFKKLMKLIKHSKKIGANYVKIQIYDTNELSSKNSKAAKYQKKVGDNQFNILKKYELTNDTIIKIIKYCNQIKIKLLATCFDIKSFRNYKKISKSNIYKISSGDLNNLPLLFEVAKSKKKIILSTGMAKIEDIDNALKTIIFAYKKRNNYPNLKEIKKIKLRNNISKYLKNKIYILHCVSSYPAMLNQLNLKYILTLSNKYNLKIGFSDHSKSLISGSVAVSLGAKILEKHITLNNKSKGPDHSSSLNVADFKKYIENIRNTEEMLGSTKKTFSNDEIKNSKVVMKSIYARKPIKKGEVFSLKNLVVKRPYCKKRPHELWSLLGKKSKKNYYEEQVI